MPIDRGRHAADGRRGVLQAGRRAAILSLVVLLATLIGACAARPPSPATAPVAFTTAEQAYQRGDFDRASKAYRIFLDHPSDEAYVPRAWYKLALCYYRLKQYRIALGALDELAARYPNETWPQAEALRGDVHLALGNKVSALEAWAAAWRVAEESDRAALRSRFDRTVETLNPEERRHAEDIITSPTIRTWLERPPAPPASVSAAARPERVLAAPPVTRLPVAPPSAVLHVGCLLPLSGRYRTFGEHSLQGIRLAFADQPDAIVVEDTRGDPAAGRAALAKLIRRDDVVAVIGPLSSEVAASAVPLAQPAGLPLVLLAQREGLVNPFVLQPVMTRTRQAETLAQQALQRHWRHVGILAPADGYGRSFTERFRTALERMGGRVTWSDSYPARQLDATAQIAQARERFRRGALDAIFLPDSAEAAIAIGAAARAAMPGIGLLGPNDWDNPATLSQAGTRLDGAIYVVGFFPDSARPATRAFVEAFRRAHQTTPDVLAAQAYDAASLVRAALRNGATTRQSVPRTLRQLGRVTGATGDLEIDERGATRPLYLLRVTAGRVEELPE